MEIGQVHVSNRPLLDTRADANLFVGRERELSRLTRALDLGLNVLLAGPAGVGKTSLLRQLAWRSRPDHAESAAPRQICYVQAGRARSVGELIALVARGLGVREADVHQPGPGQTAGPGQPGQASDPFDQLALLTKALSGLPRPAPRSVVILDEPELDAAIGLFARLRDEVWEVPLTWIVALDPAGAAALDRPPSNAFFEITLDVGPLPPEDLRAMLDRRLPKNVLTPAARDELAADGRPRQALDAARSLLTGTSWSELSRVRRERAEAVSRLGRPARLAVDAIEALGGSASASDPLLLDRLGWSRVRAVQVLGALEQAGVLAAHDERGRGQGRPRKVYRLRDRDEVAISSPAAASGAA